MGTRTRYSAGTFCWADLASPDPAGAKAFYTGLLGWAHEDMPAGDGPDYTMCSIGGATVAGLYEATDRPPQWVNYVTVEDADATAARAQELGGTVVAGPFDVMEAGRMVAIVDPQGAMLAAWKPARHSGAGVVNEPGAMAWNDLQTSDVAAAREFYSGLFGWTIEEVPGSDGAYFGIQGPEGSNGGMMPLPAPGIPPHWQPYFAVEDLEVATSRAEELGAEKLAGPMPVPSGAFAALRDPQGAVFSVLTGELDP